MNYTKILDRISFEYNNILKDNLVGIYVHGSIAFGCFNPVKSDVDFMVVVKESLNLQEKEALIKTLLNLSTEAPPKGFEMSVVLFDVCRSFVYPTPFELHFSNAHIHKCRENLTEYCKTMNGTDKDLAAHFTVINSVGFVLCGNSITDTFGAVPKEDYLDSIKFDVENAETDVIKNPVYSILSLCRVLAYMTDSLVLSKEQGGLWGLKILPVQYTALIQTALEYYRSDKSISIETQLAQNFCQYMTDRIFVK